LAKCKYYIIKVIITTGIKIIPRLISFMKSIRGILKPDRREVPNCTLAPEGAGMNPNHKARPMPGGQERRPGRAHAHDFAQQHNP
jgi:hypothetical protein